jgi:hypothetical protein
MMNSPVMVSHSSANGDAGFDNPALSLSVKVKCVGALSGEAVLANRAPRVIKGLAGSGDQVVGFFFGDGEGRRDDQAVTHGAHDETIGEGMVAGNGADMADIAETLLVRSFLSGMSSSAPNQTLHPRFADHRMITKAEPTLAEIGANLVTDAVHQLLAFHNGEIGDRRGTGSRMTRIGVAVIKFSTLFVEHIGDAVRHDHPAHRQIARRHALGDRHQVGLCAVSVGTEPLAGAAETADDFVGNEKDVAFIQDPA